MRKMNDVAIGKSSAAYRLMTDNAGIIPNVPCSPLIQMRTS